MNVALIILLFVLIGYGSGLVFEAVAEGEQSKLLRFASTGTFDEDWLPFFLDAQMKKIYDLKRDIGLEALGLPNILQFGELHNEQGATIETANIAFNIGIVKTIIDGKPTLQNVIDACYFHAEQDFGPLCVICKILDKDGNVVGAGMVKDDKEYSASDTIEIKLTPVRPFSDDNGDDDGEDDDNHDSEKDHNDEDDYRKYFDNKDFNKYFNKDDFKKFFNSNEFKKYSNNNHDDDHDDDKDDDHDDDNDDKDSECDCEKPDKFTVQYNGPDGVTVEIYKNANDVGQLSKRLFTFLDTFNNEALIELDSNLNLDQNTVNANTVYNFLINGASIGSVSIHTSCSQPLFVDQMFFFHQGQLDEIKLTVKSGTRNDVPSIPPSSTCEEDDNGNGDHNGELPNDVQKVEGVKVILCKPPSKGCTPGFWKQKQHFEFWENYSPSQTFFSVFDRMITIKVDNKDKTNPTLLEALKAQGGCVNALARHTVAALLNAASGIGYPFSEAEIIEAFQDAYD